MSLFPFAEYWWFYCGFTAFVLIVLALDLGVCLQCQLETCSKRDAATASRFAEHQYLKNAIVAAVIAERTALHNPRKSALFSSKHLMLEGCVPK